MEEPEVRGATSLPGHCMPPAAPTPHRLNRLRWYLGVVGLIGSLALAIHVSDPPTGDLATGLAIAGLPISIAYLGCAVLFEKAGRSPVLLGVLGTAMLWFLAMIGVVLRGGDAGLVIPVVLFGAIPCANALMVAWDWRKAA